jgi:hypothetical protein
LFYINFIIIPALETLTVEAAAMTDETGTVIPKMNDLCAYVKRQWIEKATIGPDRMSVWLQQDRTNNAVERFHGQLRQTFKAHDSTWRFLGQYMLRKATLKIF